MNVGFTTTAFADEFLSGEPTDWPALEFYSHGDGSAVDTTLTGTAFSEAMEGMAVVIDYTAAKVVAYVSETELTLDRPVNATGPLYFFSANQFDSADKTLKKKIRLLKAAYNQLTEDASFSFSEPYTESDQKAQCLIAAEMWNFDSKHLKNQRLGLESYSVGDESYSYGSSSTGWPARVTSLLSCRRTITGRRIGRA